MDALSESPFDFNVKTISCAPGSPALTMTTIFAMFGTPSKKPPQSIAIMIAHTSAGDTISRETMNHACIRIVGFRRRIAAIALLLICEIDDRLLRMDALRSLECCWVGSVLEIDSSP
mmetsp:Transcript_14265/g.23278  ORF Transcript_14265/g.23278 Transcript_14265/m.23278 type:complete len:117 (-) Transcript_14265:182-532(-)